MHKNEKDLRHIKRSELLEIIYRYQQNEKTLREENEALKAALADRSIKISNAGSLAQAALMLNGVFEAAQAAADQYLEQVRELLDRAEKQAEAALPREACSDAERVAECGECNQSQ